MENRKQLMQERILDWAKLSDTLRARQLALNLETILKGAKTKVNGSNVLEAAAIVSRQSKNKIRSASRYFQ